MTAIKGVAKMVMENAMVALNVVEMMVVAKMMKP